jgi:hypothetical protein
MEALEQLISIEERKIDHLLQIRNQPDILSGSPNIHFSEDNDTCHVQQAGDLEHCIEKAYEQLAIYKIRKYMEF